MSGSLTKTCKYQVIGIIVDFWTDCNIHGSNVVVCHAWLSDSLQVRSIAGYHDLIVSKTNRCNIHRGDVE